MRIPYYTKRQQAAAAERQRHETETELARRRGVAASDAADVGRRAISGFSADFRRQRREAAAAARANRAADAVRDREQAERAVFDEPVQDTYDKAFALFRTITEPRTPHGSHAHGHGGHHGHAPTLKPKPRPPLVRSTKKHEHLAHRPHDVITTAPISLGRDPAGRDLVIQWVSDVDERYPDSRMGRKCSMAVVLSARDERVPDTMTRLGSLQIGYHSRESYYGDSVDRVAPRFDVPYNTWFEHNGEHRGSERWMSQDDPTKHATLGEMDQALEAFDAMIDLTVVLTSVGDGSPIDRDRTLDAIAFIGT